MGPALERLLASPSALRLLRYLENNNHTVALSSRHASSKYLLHHTSCMRSSCLTPLLPCRRTSTLSRNPIKDQPKDRVEHVHRNFLALLSDLRSPPTRKDGTYLAVLRTPLLQSARPGEYVFDTLLFQADVAAPASDFRDRLVDRPEYSYNMDLWLELLRFRKRVHGQDGVVDVWSGLMRRHLHLPLTGHVADAMWAIFIDAAFADLPFLHQIYHHLRHLRQDKALERPNLYRDIIGGLLRVHPHEALDWHRRMHDDAMMPLNPAAAIFEHALHSRRPKKAFRRFKTIYQMTYASDLYDLCMPSVIDFCDFRTTLIWHNLFIQNNDHPSPTLLSNPVVRHLHVHANDHTNQVGQNQYTELTNHTPTSRDLPLLSRENMNTLVGDAHGIRQKKIGDAFCARLFATGAFSVELVVAGLRMLGLETLGSLALREIAARASSLSDYLVTIRSLETAGVRLTGSTFSRALQNFAEQGNEDYFNAVVQGDRHPDTYEDVKLQERLYGSFLAEGKVLEAHTTLAILTISQSHPDSWRWNFLLQTYAKISDRQCVTQTLHEMRLLDVPVSEYSLHVIFHTLLRRRRRGNNPVHSSSHSHDLDFVANVFLTTLRSGQGFNPARWREILRRYGMTNRLMSLERLCFWLVLWYSPRIDSGAAVIPSSSVGHHTGDTKQRGLLSPLKQVFSKGFLRAVVSWGFIGAFTPTNYERELAVPFPSPEINPSADLIHPERWARGIALVKQLEHYGVRIPHDIIRREVRFRLWILFDVGRSAAKHNRTARKNNKRPLSHYVRHIEKVWGGNFFCLPPDMRLNYTSTDEEMRHAVFGDRWKSRYHIDSPRRKRREAQHTNIPYNS